MADNKFLNETGLQYFYNKLLTKFPEGTDFSKDFTVVRDENQQITSISLNLGDGIKTQPVDDQDPTGPQELVIDTGDLFVDMFREYVAGDVPTGKTDADNVGKQILRVNPNYLQFEYVDSNTTELRLNVNADGIGAALAQESGNGTPSPTEGVIYYNTITHKLSYILPAATTSVRGGVRVGDGLTTTDTDKLQVNIDNDTIVFDNTSPTKKIKVADNKFAPLSNVEPDPQNPPIYKIPSAYLPSYVDEVTEGYYVPANTTIQWLNPSTGTTESITLTEDTFFKNRTGEGTTQSPYIYSNELADETDKIYVDLATNKTYRYGGTTYVEISSGAFDIINTSDIDRIMGISNS